MGKLDFKKEEDKKESIEQSLQTCGTIYIHVNSYIHVNIHVNKISEKKEGRTGKVLKEIVDKNFAN